MKILNEKTLKNSNGITLIALVITIIVLLILAGISIATLSGDNSILSRASDAKENTDLAQKREELQLAITDTSIDYYNRAKTGTLRDYLFSSEGQSKIKSELGSDDVTFDESNHTITYKGVIFEIAEDGTVSEGTKVASIEIEKIEPEELPNDFWIASEGTAYINTKYIDTSASGSNSGSGSGSGSGTKAQPGICQYTKLTVPSKINGETVTSFSVANVNNIVLLDIEDGINDFPEMNTIMGTIQQIVVPRTVNVEDTNIKAKIVKNFTISKNASTGGATLLPKPIFKYKVGDVVAYTADAKTYTTDISLTGADESVEVSTQQNLIWKILSVNGETGEIKITPGVTAPYIKLKGATGYMRGTEELHNVCKALYSNDTLGLNANNLTIEELRYAADWDSKTDNNSKNYAIFPGETTLSNTTGHTATGDSNKIVKEGKETDSTITIVENGVEYTYTKVVHGSSTQYNFYTGNGVDTKMYGGQKNTNAIGGYDAIKPYSKLENGVTTYYPIFMKNNSCGYLAHDFKPELTDVLGGYSSGGFGYVASKSQAWSEHYSGVNFDIYRAYGAQLTTSSYVNSIGDVSWYGGTFYVIPVITLTSSYLTGTGTNDASGETRGTVENPWGVK